MVENICVLESWYKDTTCAIYELATYAQRSGHTTCHHRLHPQAQCVGSVVAARPTDPLTLRAGSHRQGGKTFDVLDEQLPRGEAERTV